MRFMKFCRKWKEIQDKNIVDSVKPNTIVKFGFFNDNIKYSDNLHSSPHRITFDMPLYYLN